VVFSILLIISLVLLLTAMPTSANGERLWWMGGAGSTPAASPNLIPFAGIASLWSIGVVRDSSGRGGPIFCHYFPGSGLLYRGLIVC
jgi:hypothetical protein